MDSDNCDRCGALGATRFLFANGMDLVFCGHHAREYAETELTEMAVEDVQFRSYDQPTLIGA